VAKRERTARGSRSDSEGTIGWPYSLAGASRVLIRAGVLAPARPDRALAQLRMLRAWGPTLAGGCRAAAVRSPGQPAVADERRRVTYGELDARTDRLANALAARGVASGSRVALYCRNHVGLVEAAIALDKLGAVTTLVNTGIAAEPLRAVLDEFAPVLVIADAEFVPRLPEGPNAPRHIVAWRETRTRQDAEGESASDDDRISQSTDVRIIAPTLDELVSAAPDTPREPPERPGRVVMLTSGTTGVPRGARRPTPPGLTAAASVLSRIPLRAGDVIHAPAPLFHTWGYAALQLALPLRACLVLRRRFDPEDALRVLSRERATACVAIPIMLQRMLALPEEVRRRYPTPALRTVAYSGSAMPSAAVTAFLDAFGDVLYNLYGTTEVSWVSIATPTDLRAAPDSAGRPPLGTAIAVLDDAGEPVERGVVGRIFVRNDMLFEGYTSGAGKQTWREHMATGDLGRVDEAGRLYVSGRDDDMIVSGGENAYPQPVTDALSRCPGVRDAAVIGVPDEEFGQRFAAYVVTDPGARLTADEVRAYVAARLARYLVPRDIVFVDELPRNATGKVLLRELRARHAAQPTSTGMSASDDAPAASDPAAGSAGPSSA
jgi:acyl-CoA synthetase (AMP-forming)/AMP-acid ligase II